ncbi:MAG: extracellular solute-binding protein [Aristaeellaceae bacterium]
MRRLSTRALLAALLAWLLATGCAWAETAQWIAVDEAACVWSAEETFSLMKRESHTFTLTVPEDGDYILSLRYLLPEHATTQSSLGITLDGEQEHALVYSLWCDGGEAMTDRFGNEFAPSSIALDEPHDDVLRAYSSINRDPLVFHMSAGEHTLTLCAETQRMTISAVRLLRKTDDPTRASYAAERQQLPDTAQGVITMEAEDYALKSHAYITAANVQDASLSPYDVYTKRLNVIGTVNKGSGYQLLWRFHVDHPGWYRLGMRYSQDTAEGIPAFCDLLVDGAVPYDEMRGVPLPYTNGDYRDYALRGQSGEPLSVYLEAGDHTLLIHYNGARMQPVTDQLYELMTEINGVGVEIKKIAGISNDNSRIWDMEQYMPDLSWQMEDWQRRLRAVYNELGDICGGTPDGASAILMGADMLARLNEKLGTLPSRLGEFNEGSGSVTQTIGNLLPDLYDQMFAIDRIYLFTDEMPSSGAGLLTSASNLVKSFFYSFTDASKGNSAIGSTGENELQFWVAGSVAYVETLQRMADAYFTPQTGIPVRFSVLSDANKVLLAVAADEAPDGVLGIASHLPFQLAIRGAVEDLSGLPGFKEFVLENFNPNVLQPYVFEDGVYALCERMDFYVLFYRRDILEQLGISIPETWTDVQALMPALNRQGMSFYIPLSASSGLKPFYATLPFIFQMDGALYSEDGIHTAIDTDRSVQGFKLMTDLYNIYAFDKQTVNFYNSFRYGTTPMGVASLNQYLMLTNSAPEIANLWDLALSPGVEQEDGSINRSYTAATNACIILKGADTDRAWTFLKWWMSTDVQATYAAMLQNQYGPEYLWNSANLNAFAQLDMDDDHREVILKSWEQIREAPSHPATYMLEREISNAWIDTVVNGQFYRAALDEAIININRDIVRKLEEFGYTAQGEKVRDFVITDINDLLAHLEDDGQ